MGLAVVVSVAHQVQRMKTKRSTLNCDQVMEHTRRRWIVASASGLAILLCMAMPPVRPEKARAARIHAVNNLAHPFPQRAFVLTNVAVTNLATTIPGP